jgi:hypothetical protein
VALKVRVTATHEPFRRGPEPPLIYRAEAYDDVDGFREQRWTCEHEHGSVETAFNCGMDWLAAQPQ